jgi:hypothetical protein
MILFLMSNWLGIDKALLQKTSSIEQKLFRFSGLFIWISLLTMFVADTYFGYLFNGNISGCLSGMLILGFIHYSVYRLCLLTLVTRPFIEPEIEVETTAKKPLVKMKLSALKPSLPWFLRFIFTGFIAIAVAFPASTLMHHKLAEKVLEDKRAQLISEIPEAATEAINAVKDGSFPFLVFEGLLHQPTFILTLIFVIALVYSPLLLLSYLRNGSKFNYTRLLRDAQKEEVRLDYFITLKDAQRFLDKQFNTSINLEGKSIYADAPFNTKLKNEKVRKFGTRVDFVSYLKSL